MREKPVRVIHMAPLGTGGITNLTVSINELIDSDKVQFDYLVFRNRKEFMEDRINLIGAKKQIVDLENIKNPLLRLTKKMFGMVTLFKRQKYDVVHVDASTPYDVIVAVAAKIAGIPRIILHSHNDSYKKGKSLKDYAMPIFKQIMLCTCTDYLAISEPAAKFMFPVQVLNNHLYSVVKNAIKVENYVFSEEIRKKERDRLNISSSDFVLGNVGRFVYQKNHDFMIDVFACLHREHPDTRLLLVGEGPLEQEIKTTIKQKGLEDAVIFYGVTHNVSTPLCAMDAFIFPSRFEGLGIVAVEAQTNGLPVWCAETITQEAKICDSFQYIHGWDAENWAKTIWERRLLKKESRVAEAKDAGYDLDKVAERMQELYLERA